MSNNTCRPTTNDRPATISPTRISVGGMPALSASNGSVKCEDCRDYHHRTAAAAAAKSGGCGGARATFRRKHFGNASFSSSISQHGGRCFRLLTSRQFLFSVIVVLALFAIACLIALLVVSTRNGRPVEDADFLNSHSDWRDNCERTCNKKFDVPPLLLISMDGFRADYLNHDLTPAVKRIMSCGTRAEYMLPSYPSKTFPNHYSIVTGLYPESHGIVDNLFMDADLPETFFSKRTNDSAWYWGEPIWNTMAKNNRKSATFYWPGSEVPIQGIRPTYLYLYNKSTPFSKRVDQVIDWLLLDDANLPYFLAMYFEQPDSSCHAEGPDSDLVKSGLIYVDSMINYLMYRLDKEGLLGCLNIVIVSDHGGQALESSKFLPVDDYLPVENDENMEVFGGAVGHLNFHNLAQVNATMLVDTFACKTNHSFRVFTKQTIPKRYHYTNSDRVGPLIFDGYPGARVFRTRKDAEELKDKGDHGYDNRNREMRAIFGGYGPDIREKTIIPPFQNIELYNLMSDLLRLPFSAPNNGTRGVLYNVLRRPPDVVETEVVELHPCENADLVKCGDGCYFKLDLIPHDRDAAADCQRLTPIDASQHTADTLDLCALDFCNATMAFSRRLLMPMFVESILTAPLQNIDHRANCSAWVRIRVPQNRILSPSNVTMSSLFEPDAAGEAEAEEGSPPPSANDALSNAEMTNWKVVGAQGRNRRNEKSAGRYSADVIGAEEVREGKQDKEKEEEERMDEAKLCLSAKATKGQRWISLFPDNDYTRYVVQGQVRVPTGFYNGPWKHMLDLVVKYQRHYRKIVMYAGPIFDRRNSGVADDDILHPRESAYFDSTMNTMRPTHIFLILLRCPGAKWQADFRACERTEDTSTLAFMLPLIEKEDNCLFVEEYLFMNTCRIRDIELLTHLEWFTDRRVYSAETALRLRTAIPEQLWQLEVDAQQRRSGESG